MLNATKRSAADVLLELLDFVSDADQLERLLEAENLLRILLARGMSKDEIRTALKTKLPGELLLEVFRSGAKAEDLLAHCTPPAKAKTKTGAPKKRTAGEAGRRNEAMIYAPPAEEEDEAPSARPVYPPSTPFEEVHGIHKAAAFGLLMVVMFPALFLSGFFPEARVSPVLLIAIATVGAALCGMAFVKGRAPLWVGAVGGLLVAPGALVAIALWTSGRTSVYRLEIALAFFLGAAPGLVVYYLLFKNANAASRSEPHGLDR